jgi:CheY-like chemotaxis protein
MMDRMLKRLGCEVTLAENGKAAVQLIMGQEVNTPGSEYSTSNGIKISGPILAQNSDHASVSSDTQRKFNLTFMDNQMPIMSGLQAIKFLRGQGRKDFVVGLTGNALLPGMFSRFFLCHSHRD